MNDCGISKLDLKRRNRMQILKVVREQGPISRVDISAILGITRAAVTIITNEMIDQHILQEVGEEPVNPNAEVRKGRRKILLDINETYKFAIGIYVDEKEISIGLTTLNAAALDKRSITHKADMTPEALAELLGTTLEKMLQNSCLTYENLLGIGVGIGLAQLAGGLIGGNIMCKLSGKKVNPLIGSAGVSAVPMAARVSQMVGQKANPANFLLMHAMGPNVAGVIGSAIAAGFLLAVFG